MKKKKLLISGSLIVIVSAVLAISILTGQFAVTDIVSVAYPFDTGNKSQSIGYYDCTFVAFVNEKQNTIYEFLGDELSIPRINYSVTVLQNIKGPFECGDTVTLRKSGGLTKDKRYFIQTEGDIFPQEGKIYVFSATIQMDGGVYSSSPNSTVELEQTLSKKELVSLKAGSIEKQLDNSAVYKEFVEAAENEIPFNRERNVINADGTVSKTPLQGQFGVYERGDKPSQSVKHEPESETKALTTEPAVDIFAATTHYDDIK